MWDMIQKGGPMMYLIILSSVLAFGVVIERVYNLNRARIDADKFIDDIMNVMKRNKIIEAIELCNTTPGPIAHIVKAGILKHDRSKHEIKEAIDEAAQLEVPRLEKHLPILATVAHIAPLLGLLGTVTGMIRTFKAITIAGIGNPTAMASGIAEALITTAAGLMVAIPAFVVYRYLRGKVDALVIDMEKEALKLVQAIDRTSGTRPQAAVEIAAIVAEEAAA